ncbi:MAG: PolC-type DNA polymerase III [Clostridium sp.]|nr:PolC-type DNA polymerase III [Clostridium sp.]MCM1444762.1 PolC-type DNA polymerase III [Candidatus Amulumruptor caecigallinarius]
MHDKLIFLLDQIKFPKEYYDYFLDGNLVKIISNKANTSYVFVIEIDNILPVEVYDILKKLLIEKYNTFDYIGLRIEPININNDFVNDYYKYVINKEEFPLLEMYLNYNVKLENQVLNIECENGMEQTKLLNIKDKFIDIFKSAGYGNIDVDVTINHSSNEGLLEQAHEDLISDIKQINETKKDEKKDIKEEKHKFSNYRRTKTEDKPDVVLGKTITTEPTNLSSIYSEIDDVTVIVSVFGIDYFESSKSDFKIITLKITDQTDSLYCKVFTKSDDEYNDLRSKLKEGNYYKIRGYTKNDMYSKELVLNARDINIVDNIKEPRIDTCEEKRVELHAHTMMSQMDGLTKLDLGKHTCELVERTIQMGYRGVAITDHNGCQAFPISFSIINGHNKKIRNKIKENIVSLEEEIKNEKNNEKIEELNKRLEKEKETLKKPPIFKGIYGTELTLVDDTVNIVVRPTDDDLIHNTYVVFDTETTGFNAGDADQMIEIGAVKIKDGEIIDRFDELIDPKRHIPDRITELTCITDDMVRGKKDENQVTKMFLEWVGNLPLVAHNAKFDISFIQMAMKKYNLGELENTVIDTLELSRALDQGFSRHSLSALVKRYDVVWDEDAHHRADYDAEGTALVFSKMLKKLEKQRFEKISDLDNLISKDEIHKFGRCYHFNAIALNKKGLKNLFTIISLANTVYLYKTPRILRSKLSELREGLLIGSGCYESEVFTEARSKEGKEFTNIINFYDYVEVQPVSVYNHLIQLGDFKDENELKSHLKKIISAVKEAGKIIVATGDVHHFDKEDKIYREIIVNQKVPGGGRHPLAKKDITNIPSQHFRTTNEMLDDFNFLDKDLAYEIVVKNTNKVLDMVEEIEVIPDTGGTPYSPRVKSDDETSYLDCPRVVTDLVYTKANDWYGNPLPYSIEERLGTELYGDIVLTSIKHDLKNEDPNNLEKESFKRLHEVILSGKDAVLNQVRKYLKETDTDALDEEGVEKKLKSSLGGVIGAGFDPIYLIAQRLVKRSNDDGFLVGSRGSVGSSFVATMMGITEVNPLSAHYRCSKCKLSLFEDENHESLGKNYSCGFDLPDLECPNCHIPMIKDGQDMPFATFLGFNADKVPDIDLNFSDLNQADIHAYTKVLFGSDNVYRAGTIGTVADKTAFGFVKGYLEEKGITSMRTAEIERLSIGCTGVKRTTGQHPGGIVVIPDYMDCFDFTPFQFPADDPTSAWRTTHFDYHSIEECVLKLDILGHSDPTQLRLIQLQSGTDIMAVPLDDKETMSIFTSTKVLGVTEEEILCKTGTLGIPEFGTPFTIQLVEDTKPTTFAELVKISGLSHGTDVWLGNAKDLCTPDENGNIQVPFKETIGCRDDIMVYLMYHGVKPIKAFKIMEFVRKGKASKDPETWASHVETMREASIPEWFIESCRKIKYMFPKAHAAAYVISAFRIAWYKVHMPVYFYASWYSSKATDVDIDAMIGGYTPIKNRILDIQNKGYDATNKENGQLESLKIALEATARGMKFLNVDLYQSEATVWKVVSDTEIYPPFIAIDGLGETVAKKIVDERNIKSFMSIEDFAIRGKVSSTLVEKMRSMGIFDGMDESSQLTLF